MPYNFLERLAISPKTSAYMYVALMQISWQLFLHTLFFCFVFSSLTSISIGVLITHLVRNKNRAAGKEKKNSYKHATQPTMDVMATQDRPLLPLLASHDAERIHIYISTGLTIYEYCWVQFCFRLCNYYKKINWTIVASFRLNSSRGSGSHKVAFVTRLHSIKLNLQNANAPNETHTSKKKSIGCTRIILEI